jgi:hypothetical protein
MLLSNITCPQCRATFVAADAHVTVPRFPRRWWQLSGERSEYKCPKCGAFCVMRLHPAAIAAAFAVIGGAVWADLAGLADRRVALAVGGTLVVMLLRFGLRARPE